MHVNLPVVFPQPTSPQLYQGTMVQPRIGPKEILLNISLPKKGSRLPRINFQVCKLLVFTTEGWIYPAVVFFPGPPDLPKNHPTTSLFLLTRTITPIYFSHEWLCKEGEQPDP